MGEPMDTQGSDILDIMGPGLMAILTPMDPILTLMEMVPTLTPMDPTPTTLLARGLLILMLSLLLTLTMVHMPMDPTPTMLLARDLLMLSPLLIPTMAAMDMLLLTVMDMLPDLMDMLPMPRIPMDPDTMDTDGNYIPPSANNQPPCMLPDSEEDLKFSCGRCH